jgi:hypothetical protein
VQSRLRVTRRSGRIVTIEVDETTLRVYDQRGYLITTLPAPAARRSPDTRHREQPNKIQLHR